MFRTPLVIGLLLAVAFLPETLAAQLSSNDSGQYVILSAQYGTARRHVDVTNRLKSLPAKTASSAWATARLASTPTKGRTRRSASTPVGQMGRIACSSIAKAVRLTAHSSAAGWRRLGQRW